MNKVVLVGRLTKDPEVRYAQNDNSTAIARFTVACDRKIKDSGADFISCVAFGKTAEFLEKYFAKGSKIGLTGHIQTGNFTNKDGQKVYTTDVIVDEVEFVESKSAASNEAPAINEAAASSDGFMNIPDGLDEDLPFN